MGADRDPCDAFASSPNSLICSYSEYVSRCGAGRNCAVKYPTLFACLLSGEGGRGAAAATTTTTIQPKVACEGEILCLGAEIRGCCDARPACQGRWTELWCEREAQLQRPRRRSIFARAPPSFFPHRSASLTDGGPPAPPEGRLLPLHPLLLLSASHWPTTSLLILQSTRIKDLFDLRTPSCGSWARKAHPRKTKASDVCARV